jgi:hypothetical protein
LRLAGGGGRGRFATGGGFLNGICGCVSAAFCFAAASSFFFSSSNFWGIPMGDCWASIKSSHNSEANFAACSSPKNPAMSICAVFGSTVVFWFPLSSGGDGKKRLTAVLCTISSSNPSKVVILCSIHCVNTGLFTLLNLTRVEKFAGNFVDLIALLWALESGTEEVPLMEGMVTLKRVSFYCYSTVG